MPQDRYRYGRDDFRDRNAGWRDRDETSFGRGRQDWDDRDRDEDGYIARRGFGNESSGYGRGRERDFGDSAGYGSGGSARDWRDVVGEDRGRGGPVFDSGDDPSRDWGYPRYGSGSSSDYERDRYGSGHFGRGSRDYSEDRGFFERAGDEVRSWFGDSAAERRREMDSQTGEYRHRGRGPKGYQRSDERILEDVNDRLTDDPHIDASDIEVTVKNREVTLNGLVKSRFEKRHAEDLADSVSGVTHVQNNLRIQQYADAGIAGSMLSGAGAAGAGTTGALEENATGMTGPADAAVPRRRTRSTSGT